MPCSALLRTRSLSEPLSKLGKSKFGVIGTTRASLSTPCPHIALRRRNFSSSPRSTSTASASLPDVKILPTWDPVAFEVAFKQQQPARLARSKEHLPPACSKWFVHARDSGRDRDNGHRAVCLERAELRDTGQGHAIMANDHLLLPVANNSNELENVSPLSSELRMSFWSEHESTMVPLEITTRTPSGEDEFERIEAPLKLLLVHLATADASSTPGQHVESMYLAQCDLPSLPEPLQADVPTPRLLLQPSPSGTVKGDIYASSLWLGRAPTYTPLHRDPNPNLFIQLCGHKTIRLLPPDVGEALYHEVQRSLPQRSASFSSRIRGEEMMAGPQKKALHDAVWDDASPYATLMREYGLQTTLGLGDALFTPKGWWHSVKGVALGSAGSVTASVNWWFR